MDRPKRGPSLLRRYKWESLTQPEKDAVSDAMGIAATRAGVGIGVVLTTAAVISGVRRGKPPLPRLVRYGSVSFFSIVGGYIGFLSAGPLYAHRILSVPNSQLADDLRIVMGDWQARVPVSQMDPQQGGATDGQTSPDLGQPPPALDFSEGPVRTKRAPLKREAERKSFTYWLGLTKS